MFKRRLSTAELPPNKRLAYAKGSKSKSFSDLWDELVLHILSYISWSDVCRSASTSREWARLASDNQVDPASSEIIPTEILIIFDGIPQVVERPVRQGIRKAEVEG